MLSKRKEKFLDFSYELANYMKKDHTQMCFYGYGSCFNDLREDSSDLDGGIIFPRTVTDKKAVLDISQKMNSLAKKFGIDEKNIQFNFLDRETCKDGRFLSYDTSYNIFLQKYGVILSGPNFLEEIIEINNKFGEGNSASFNFREVRNSFLISYLFREEKKMKKFLKSVDLLKIKPKKIKLLRILAEGREDKYGVMADELYKKSKKDFVDDVRILLPKVDLSIFGELDFLKNQNELEKLSKNPDELVNVWGRVLGTYENIIKEYIETFPPKEISVKTLI